jgi:hypothetical protein
MNISFRASRPVSFGNANNPTPPADNTPKQETAE